MKWLLILFLGIIIVPALAQNTPINQTEYQKLENSINGLQIRLQQLDTSVNGLKIEHQQINSSVNRLQIEHQQINKTVNDLHTDHVQYDSSSRVLTAVTFIGGGAIALVFFYVQTVQSAEIKKITVQIQNVITTMTRYIEHQKMIEDSVRINSLIGISANIHTAQWQLNLALVELRKNQSIAKLNDLIYNVGFGNVLKLQSENILGYNANLKFLVLSSLHQEIDMIGQKIRVLSDLDQLNIRKIPEGHETWIALAEDTIRIIDDAIIKIKNEQTEVEE